MNIRVLLMTGTLILASSVASADITFEIVGTSGGDPDALEIGETLTIDIIMTNPEGTGVNGIGASVWDYDEMVLGFDGGAAVASYLNVSCDEPFSCIGGFENVAAGALIESEIGMDGARVQIANSIAAATVTNTGIGVDQGLDGNVGTTQFQVTFEGLDIGETTLQIGTGYSGDIVVLPGGGIGEAVNDSITITVPEPGAAAAGAVALASAWGVGTLRRRTRDEAQRGAKIGH
jgi:hypothetical protein